MIVDWYGVDDNAYCLVDGMEDWYCESVYYEADILTSYDNNNNRCVAMGAERSYDGQSPQLFAIQPPFWVETIG